MRNPLEVSGLTGDRFTRNVLGFVFGFKNGLQFYVSARFLLMNGMWSSGLLLAHQSLEALLKSLIRQAEKKPQKIHDLVELLREAKHLHPVVPELLNDHDLCEFLVHLKKAYELARFAEGFAGGNIDNWIVLLDQIVFKLWRVTLERSQSPEGQIYVPRQIQPSFLKDNAMFKSTDIVDNNLAGFGRVPPSTQLSVIMPPLTEAKK